VARIQEAKGLKYISPLSNDMPDKPKPDPKLPERTIEEVLDYQDAAKGNPKPPRKPKEEPGNPQR
jgi:hypothetical protein